MIVIAVLMESSKGIRLSTEARDCTLSLHGAQLSTMEFHMEQKIAITASLVFHHFDERSAIDIFLKAHIILIMGKFRFSLGRLFPVETFPFKL